MGFWGSEMLLLLLGGCGLGRFGAGEDGVLAARAGQHDGQADRGEHEDDGGVGGELGEEVRGTAGTEGGLRTLSAEGSCEVGRLAGLEQHDADEEEANDNVNEDEEIDHRGARNLFCLPGSPREGPD